MRASLVAFAIGRELTASEDSTIYASPYAPDELPKDHSVLANTGISAEGYEYVNRDLNLRMGLSMQRQEMRATR